MKTITILVTLIISLVNLSNAQQKRHSLAMATLATGQIVDVGEPYWRVSIHGDYSDISNAETNNGTKSGAELRIAQHWTAGGEYYTTINPSSTKIALARAYYRIGVSHLFTKPPQFFDPSQFELFAGPGVGLSLQGSAKKFAFALGGGVDRHVGSNVTLRLLDIDYVRASVLPHGGQVIGNHVQVTAGLGLNF